MIKYNLILNPQFQINKLNKAYLLKNKMSGWGIGNSAWDELENAHQQTNSGSDSTNGWGVPIPTSAQAPTQQSYAPKAPVPKATPVPKAPPVSTTAPPVQKPPPPVAMSAPYSVPPPKIVPTTTAPPPPMPVKTTQPENKLIRNII